VTVSEVRPQEPNENLVKHLEGMMEQAKTGKMQGMVAVSIWDDGTTGNGWAGPPKCYHTTIVSRRIIGELEYMKLDLMTSGRWVEREEIFG